MKGKLTATILIILACSYAIWFNNTIGKTREEENRNIIAIERVGKAIFEYERREGKLPEWNWEKNIEHLIEGNPQRTPIRHEWEDEEQNSWGWGYNTRLGLTLGEKGEQDKTPRKSTDYPGDAVLLAPNHNSLLTPNRNGWPDSWRKTGARQPVLTADGTIELLTPEQTTLRMRIRPRPRTVADEEAKAKELKWVESQDVWQSQRHTILESNSGKGPIRPIDKSTEKQTIKVSTSSNRKGWLELEVRFYNINKEEINTPEDWVMVSTKLAEKYGDGDKIELEDPIRLGKTGFATILGAAVGEVNIQSLLSEGTPKDQKTLLPPWVLPKPFIYKTRATNNSFTKGTMVTPLENRRIQQGIETQRGWATTHITIEKKNIPFNATFFQVWIHERDGKRTIIRDLGQ